MTLAISPSLKTHIRFALAVAFLLTLLATFTHYQESKRCFLHLTMAAESQEQVIVQLFYNKGRGFSQKLSATLPLESNGKFQKLSFKLPAANIREIRLDPTTVPAKITLKSAEIISFTGRTLQSLDLSKITPLKDIEAITPTPDGIVLTTASHPGLDASLLLVYSYPYQPESSDVSLLTLLSFSGRLFALLALGLTVIVACSNATIRETTSH